jgi:hypothetical protein
LDFPVEGALGPDRWASVSTPTPSPQTVGA